MPHSLDIISAVPTPFFDSGQLDIAGFRSNLDRLEPHVDGVLPAGTTGEFPALDAAERLDLLVAALDVFGPQRVVAHVGSASSYQADQLAGEARRAGAVRFAAITPYYIAASPSSVAEYFRSLRTVIGGGELYAYLYPDVARTDIEPADFGKLIEAGIDGVKISGAASSRIEEYADVIPPGFKVWSGNDADLPRIARLGCTGTVSGVSAVCPEPWARLRDAAAAGDWGSVTATQAIIEQLVAALGPSIAHLKYGLDVLGFCGGRTRMAIDAPTEDEMARIKSALALLQEISTTSTDERRLP